MMQQRASRLAFLALPLLMACADQNGMPAAQSETMRSGVAWTAPQTHQQALMEYQFLIKEQHLSQGFLQK